MAVAEDDWRLQGQEGYLRGAEPQAISTLLGRLGITITASSVGRNSLNQI